MLLCLVLLPAGVEVTEAERRFGKHFSATGVILMTCLDRLVGFLSVLATEVTQAKALSVVSIY